MTTKLLEISTSFLSFIVLYVFGHVHGASASTTRPNILMELVARNHLNSCIFITDETLASKPIILAASSLYIKTTIIAMNQEGNISNSLFESVSSLGGRQVIFAWCNNECQERVTVMAQRIDLLRKRFVWVVVKSLQERDMGIHQQIMRESKGTEQHLVRLIYKKRTASFEYENISANDVDIGNANTGPYPLQGLEFKIGTLHSPPAVNIELTGSKPVFTGFSVEVIKALAQYLGFRFTFDIEKTGFGSLKDGNWTGLVGSVFRKEFDIGGFGIAKTLERSTVVDFASYVYQTHYVAVIRRPSNDGKECSFTVYVAPFSLVVWITCAATSGFTFILLVFTTQPKSHRKYAAVNETSSLSSLLWSLISAILQTDGKGVPSQHSTQVLLMVFTICAIFICKTYTSLLTAKLTVKAGPTIYNDLDELIDDGKFGIAVMSSMSSVEFLKKAKSGTLHRIWKQIQKIPGSLVTSGKMGFMKVMKQNYAFLDVESSAGPKVFHSNCTMVILKQRYLPVTANFFFQKNSSVVEDFSMKIMAMRSSGILKKLFQQYFPAQDPKDCISKPNMTVRWEETVGAFVVLGGGVLMAFLSLLFEFIYSCSPVLR